jgi:hypothetical protein
MLEPRIVELRIVVADLDLRRDGVGLERDLCPVGCGSVASVLIEEWVRSSDVETAVVVGEDRVHGRTPGCLRASFAPPK